MVGCMKTYEYLTTEVPQGRQYVSLRASILPAYAAVSVYDQFETKAHFSVIWVNNLVTTTLATIEGRMRGEDEQAREARAEQLRATRKGEFHCMVLADVRADTQSDLADSAPAWQFVLTTPQGVATTPIEIKAIELSPAWQALFGDAYSRYTKAYRLAFALDDPTLNEQVDLDAAGYRLSACSAYRAVDFAFGSRAEHAYSSTVSTGEIDREDYYWV